MSEGFRDIKGRRSEDHSKQVQIARLLNFTDLMAVLLSFFVLLYATREPAPMHKIALEKPDLAPIVAASSIPVPVKLSAARDGLDVQYIAALLQQAQTRDPRMEGIAIDNRETALVLTLDTANITGGRYVIERIAAYRRAMDVFAPPATIAGLVGSVTRGDARYFPQNDQTALRIVVH